MYTEVGGEEKEEVIGAPCDLPLLDFGNETG